jgi:hypothetical protein
VSSGEEHPGASPQRHRLPLDELASRQGVRPVTSVEDMAEDGVFSSDEELDAFLLHLAGAR